MVIQYLRGGKDGRINFGFAEFVILEHPIHSPPRFVGTIAMPIPLLAFRTQSCLY